MGKRQIEEERNPHMQKTKKDFEKKKTKEKRFCLKKGKLLEIQGKCRCWNLEKMVMKE